MDKKRYEYKGVIYEVNKDLADKWLEREGIHSGVPADEKKYKDAMECVIVNAEGRLRLQGMELSKEAVEQAMEEIIREEIELTGGEV